MISNFSNHLRKKNQALFDTGLAYLYSELKITEEQQKMISYNIVKRLSDGSGICNAKYNITTNTLLSINIKIVDSCSVFGMLDILAHELVHAKQNFNGEFKWEKRKVPFLYFWSFDKYIRTHKGQVLEDTPYYDRLCEQEAFTKAHELMVGLVKFLDTEAGQLTMELTNRFDKSTDNNVGELNES